MTKKEAKIYFHNYYLRNKKRLSSQNKKYRDTNRLKMIEYLKIYYKNHKEEHLKKSKKYRNEHKEELTQYRKEYHLKNKKIFCEKSKKWYAEHREFRRIQYQQNKEKINSERNKYFIKRRKTDINFKLLCNLRIRIWKVLKGINKSTTTSKLLGCSVDFLKNYIENKFTKGMSWNNYGKWHIDHIRPCASFDLSKPSEQRKCFHYINLQPLWAEDNLRKNDKLI